MIKEKRIEVDKVWGEEIWLVNCADYCGKLLMVNRNAKSSYHYHKIKKETFYCLQGFAILNIEGKDYMLSPSTRAKTILPGEKHMFVGVEQTILLEVSTQHDEADVVRLTESIAGSENDYEVAQRGMG